MYCVPLPSPFPSSQTATLVSCFGSPPPSPSPTPLLPFHHSSQDASVGVLHGAQLHAAPPERVPQPPRDRIRSSQHLFLHHRRARRVAAVRDRLRRCGWGSRLERRPRHVARGGAESAADVHYCAGQVAFRPGELDVHPKHINLRLCMRKSISWIYVENPSSGSASLLTGLRSGVEGRAPSHTGVRRRATHTQCTSSVADTLIPTHTLCLCTV